MNHVFLYHFFIIIFWFFVFLALILVFSVLGLKDYVPSAFHVATIVSIIVYLLINIVFLSYFLLRRLKK